MNCAKCGFYVQADDALFELRQELESKDHDGYCSEPSNGLFITPMIHRAETTFCSKFTKERLWQEK